MSDDAPFEVKPFLRSLTHRPGVYLMLNARHKVIYVGKARDLKKRVSSYFHRTQDAPKTVAMMEQVARVEVTVANTEAEALILEYSLIKRHKPRYNVLLRDDKSYPYIYASTETRFPRLKFHRGSRRGKGRYFGPYPSTRAVRTTLKELEKLFLIRNCTDSFFSNRTRPCLQYQIKRCTAPCVDLDHARSSTATRHRRGHRISRGQEPERRSIRFVARMDEGFDGAGLRAGGPVS